MAKKKAKTNKATRRKASPRQLRRGEALTVDRRVLARLFECSLRHITELEGEGVISPLKRGRGGRPSIYALEAVIPA